MSDNIIGFLNHIDDSMANGEVVRGLYDLVDQAGATLVGIGIAVEKWFQGGDRLRDTASITMLWPSSIAMTRMASLSAISMTDAFS